MSSPTIIAAWQVVQRAAVAFADKKECAAAVNAALHDAVLAYGSARVADSATPGRVVGAGGKVIRSGKTIPFGRSRGVAIEEADTKDLRWVLGAVSESIDDESKARWRGANVELRDAIEAELETR